VRLGRIFSIEAKVLQYRAKQGPLFSVT